jgi:RNA polymerase sigma-70 factor (ECF subfamily)
VLANSDVCFSMQRRLDPEQEKLLLERALKAPDAFRRIYEHYLPRVYAYVVYRVARKQDAEDLVSETFFKVVDRLDTFEWRGEGSFSAWLFRITKNNITDYYREVDRVEIEVSLDELSEIAPDNLLPHETIRQKEKFIFLRQLIRALPPRRQEIIQLKFFGGLRNNEISQVLGIDERTVASHLCRGLEDLHRRYTREFPQPRKVGAHE